jgi:hypothetical protein
MIAWSFHSGHGTRSPCGVLDDASVVALALTAAHLDRLLPGKEDRRQMG